MILFRTHVNTSISFKNFRLSANIDFSVGGQIVSYTNMWGSSSGILDKTAELNDRGVNVREPVSKGGGIHMTGVDQNGNKVDTYVNAKLYYTTASRVWEEWVYDRTYVKLREVSLSYVFPSQTLKKLNIGLSRASVAINASNPWLIYSACPNVDVSEIGMGYFEGGNAAATRSIGFTVNLAF